MASFTKIAAHLGVVAALIGQVAGGPSIKFINNLPYTAYVWTVGPAKSNVAHSTDAEAIVVPGNGGSIIHPLLDSAALGGGLSLKFRDVNHYQVAPAGILQAEYSWNVTTGQVWYDLSAINCDPSVPNTHPYYCPFIYGHIKMYAYGQGNEDCAVAECKAGTCQKTYQAPGTWPDEPTLNCFTYGELHVVMGAEGHFGPQTLETSAPAPAPAVSSASAPVASVAPAVSSVPAPEVSTPPVVSSASPSPEPVETSTHGSHHGKSETWAWSIATHHGHPLKHQHTHAASVSPAPAQASAAVAPVVAPAQGVAVVPGIAPIVFVPGIVPGITSAATRLSAGVLAVSLAVVAAML